MIYILLGSVSSFENYWGGAPRTISISYSAKVCVQLSDLYQALQPIQPFGEGLKVGISHLNDLCFHFLEFLGATT